MRGHVVVRCVEAIAGVGVILCLAFCSAQQTHDREQGKIYRQQDCINAGDNWHASSGDCTHG